MSNDPLHRVATLSCLVLGLAFVSLGAILAAFPQLGGVPRPLIDTGGGFLLASGFIQWKPSSGGPPAA